MTYQAWDSNSMFVGSECQDSPLAERKLLTVVVRAIRRRRRKGAETHLHAVRRKQVASFVIALAALAASARAQTHTQTFNGPPGATMPDRFAPCGDLNQDGVPDVIAGVAQPIARAFVFSGADGSIIHTFSAPGGTVAFGKAVAGGVDVSGDLVPDILVGAHSDALDAGHFYLYSGATFALIRQHAGVAGQNLGRPVAFLDDLDGDGTPEYAAGATHVGGGNRVAEIGQAYVYSGATGNVMFPLVGESAGDLFGEALAGMGLIDGDTVPDFAVGASLADAPTKGNCGAVYLYSGQTGQLIRKDEGPTSSDRVGKSVVSLGDLNKDGLGDYVTSWSAPTNGALVISGTDGTTLSSMQAAVISALAPEVGSVSDVDGDGGRDVVLANWGPTGRADGYVSVVGSLSGLELLRIDDPVETASDSFPGIAKGVGDLDLDGREEIGAVDLFDDPLGGGSIYTFSTRPLYALDDEISASAPGVIPFDVNAGVPYAGGTYFFLVSVTPLGGQTPCMLMSCGDTGSPIGPLPVYLPMCLDAVTPFGIQLMNQKPFLGMFGSLDETTGKSSAPLFDLTNITMPAALQCFSFNFAYVAKPGNGGPWDFVSNAEAVLIVP